MTLTSVRPAHVREDLMWQLCSGICIARPRCSQASSTQQDAASPRAVQASVWRQQPLPPMFGVAAMPRSDVTPLDCTGPQVGARTPRRPVARRRFAQLRPAPGWKNVLIFPPGGGSVGGGSVRAPGFGAQSRRAARSRSWSRLRRSSGRRRRRARFLGGICREREDVGGDPMQLFLRRPGRLPTTR